MLSARVAGFDWDDGNRDKCRKHGVSLGEIEAAFVAGPLVMPDRSESPEARYNAVGITPHRRHVFIVFALREREDALLIRPISARYMHRREIERYEQTRR